MSKVVLMPGAASSPVKQERLVKEDKRRTTGRPPNTSADGRKRFRMKIGTSPEGKPIMKNFTGRTRAEALAKMREYEREQEAGGHAPIKVDPVLDPAQSVGKWADRWYMVYYKGSERSQISTKSIIKRIKDSVLGQLAIGNVVQLNVQDFANVNIHSQSYTKKIRDTLRKVFDSAVANRIISASPCTGVIWEHKGAKERRPLLQWEIDVLRQNWQAHPAGIGAMIMLYTGARPDEARALNWDNIRDNDVLIRDSSYFKATGEMVLKLGVTKTKAGQRDIPITAPLRKMLDAVEREDGKLVWKSATGETLTETSYQKNWDSFIHALRCIHFGVPKNKAGNYSGVRVDKLPDDVRKKWDTAFNVTPYSLRHTFCTMLYEADVDVKTMQYLMGHNDLETTLKIYAALTEAKKSRSYEKLHRYFSMDEKDGKM